MNFTQMLSSLLSITAAKAQAQELGFEPFYQNFVIIEPIPSDEWVCGETFTIKWNKGLNITNGTPTLPPTPVGGLIDIKLVKVATPWANFNLTKYTIAVDVPIEDEQYDFFIDCETLHHLCPDCLDVDGAVIESEEWLHERWNYLLFEDSGMVFDPEDPNACDQNGLNYDNDSCWSVRSEGSVQVANNFKDYNKIEEDKVYTNEVWWMNEYNAPMGDHLYGVSTVLSHRASWKLEQGQIIEPLNYGKFEVIYSFYRGVIGAAVLKSLEDNVLVVVFRPTRNDAELMWDDWMSNFTLTQNGCADIIEDCDPSFKFHRGFLYELELSKQAIRDRVLEQLQSSPCASDDPLQWRVVFTGMSQGGGLASISYYDIKNYVSTHLDAALLPKIEYFLFSIGGPPQGNEKWALHIEKTLPKYARDRAFLTFDEELGYERGPIRFGDFNVGPVGIFALEDAIECLAIKPPLGADTPAWAGWKWRSAEELGLEDGYTDNDLQWANAVSWMGGDLIISMNSNVRCKGLSGVIMIDSRFTKVFDPVYVHWDPDTPYVWCTEEGCESTAPREEEHPDAKEPMFIDSKNYTQDTLHPDRHCANLDGPAASPAIACHDIGLYAFAIEKVMQAKETIVDKVVFRQGGQKFAGCKATGLDIANIATTFIPPASPLPTEDAGVLSLAVATLVTAIAFLV